MISVRISSCFLRIMILLMLISAFMLVAGWRLPLLAQTALPPGSWRVAHDGGHGHDDAPTMTQSAQDAAPKHSTEEHLHEHIREHAHEHAHQTLQKHLTSAQSQNAPDVREQRFRLTMNQLHEMGGVPTGWQFLIPMGDPEEGREAFLHLGCHHCHMVTGGGLPMADGIGKQPGMDLGGMAGHHPPEYFADSILRPNSVIIAGPGYTGDDGLSTMPDYLDSMTVRQLVDIVAFLGSLKGKGSASSHGAQHQK